jgi:uncharacterized protein (TIGR00645 family)
MRGLATRLSSSIYAARWILFPINVGLLLCLAVYTFVFLVEGWHFLHSGFRLDLESLMVAMLTFVDASMVANLIIMIAQGGHQIFIRKFELPGKEERAQYLDHIDSGLLKVKVAQSIAGITLVQILKDFVGIDKVEWTMVYHQYDYSRGSLSLRVGDGFDLAYHSPHCSGRGTTRCPLEQYLYSCY